MYLSTSCWMCCEARVMENWNKPSQAMLLGPPARLNPGFNPFAASAASAWEVACPSAALR